MPTTFDFSVLEEMEDRLKKITKKIFLTSVSVSLVLFFILITWNIIKNEGDFLEKALLPFMVSFSLFMILFVTTQTILQKKIELHAFNKFANINGFIFTKEPKEDLKHAHFFKEGDEQKFSFCIESLNTKLPFSFFNFKYGVTTQDSKGKSHTTWYYFKVFTFYLQKNTPNIYIHNKRNEFISETFTEDQQLRLGVNVSYENNHLVYAPKEYELESLQILDREFVEKLSQCADSYDIEFYDSKMFVYMQEDSEDENASDVDKIKKLFIVYETLNEILIQKMSTFSFSQIGNLSTTLEKDPVSFLSVVIILLIFGVISAPFIAILFIVFF